MILRDLVQPRVTLGKKPVQTRTEVIGSVSSYCFFCLLECCGVWMDFPEILTLGPGTSGTITSCIV